MLTQDEIKNILSLIAVAPIKGQDSTTVALLQQKLTGLLEVKEETKE